MNGLRIAALQSDKRWPDAVNSAVACLVGHGAVEVGAVERLALSESLDITQTEYRPRDETPVFTGVSLARPGELESPTF